MGVEGLAHHGILRDRVLKGRVGLALLFHFDGTLHQSADVDARHGDGQQTNRSQNRETTTHIVRNDIGLVAFHVGQLFEGTTGFVGDSDDARGGFLFAILINDVLLEDTEGDGGFRRRARLGNDGQRVVFLVEDGHEVVEIVLAHVVAGIDDERFLASERCKVVLQGFDDGAGSQIRTANADDDENLRFLAQVGSSLLNVGQQALIDFRRQVHPAEKVVSGTSLFVNGFVNCWYS